jgi:hypothetical protein
VAGQMEQDISDKFSGFVSMRLLVVLRHSVGIMF